MGTLSALCVLGPKVGLRFTGLYVKSSVKALPISFKELLASRRFSWCMSAILALGSGLMWGFSYISLIKGGGFQGIALWQMAGIFLLPYQLYHLCSSLLSTSREVEGWRYDVKLFNACVVCANIVFNVGTIAIIVTNLILGRLTWSGVESFGLLIGFIVVGLTLVCVIEDGGKIFKSQLVIFWLAVASRAIPQLLIAWSPDLSNIPMWPILGLLLVAGQRCLVVWGMVLQAGPDSKARANLLWVLRSDLANFTSAAVAAYAVVVN